MFHINGFSLVWYLIVDIGKGYGNANNIYKYQIDNFER